MRTRRLGASLIALGIGLVGCGPAATPSASTSPSLPAAPSTEVAAPASTASPETPPSTLTPTDRCLATAQQLGLDAQVGQLYMMAIQVGTPVGQAISDLQASGAGAVILLGNSTAGVNQTSVYVEQVRAASPAGHPVLVAVDQEGGQVQRLQGPGFDRIPSAVQQGQMSDADLLANWQRWGGQLRAAGVNWDLAPVADVVPASQVAGNEPVGQLERGYASDADQVSRQVGLVVEGLAAAGVASSVKHFPGLGQVPRNTDFAVGHDQTSLLTETELAPFQAAIDAGTSSVMVSSAIYTQVDPQNPAVFSRTIVTGILRERMGFDGLVISDDLGVAASVAGYAVGQRGTLFLQAGGDMVITADAQAASTMVAGTVAAAQADPVLAAEIAVKVARIFALKQELGLMTCG